MLHSYTVVAAAEVNFIYIDVRFLFSTRRFIFIKKAIFSYEISKIRSRKRHNVKKRPAEVGTWALKSGPGSTNPTTHVMGAAQPRGLLESLTFLGLLLST